MDVVLLMGWLICVAPVCTAELQHSASNTTQHAAAADEKQQQQQQQTMNIPRPL